jgi:hypothetical protein
MRAVEREAEGVGGRRVGIMGLGPAGLIAAQMARAEGATEVVGFDLNPKRREHALTCGLNAAYDPRTAEANAVPLRHDKSALDSIVALRNWIRVADERPPLPDGDDPAELNHYPSLFRRQHVVLRLQELSPDLNARLNDVVAGILQETSGLTLFAETGLPSDRGLTIEFLERFWRRLLPAPREDGDLSKLLVRLFLTHAEADRFATMPPTEIPPKPAP